MTTFVLFCAMLIPTSSIATQDAEVEPQAHSNSTLSLAFLETTQAQLINVDVQVDKTPFDDYWDDTIAAIFKYADRNTNGLIEHDELPRLPSASAIRRSLDNGFTPPIQPITSLLPLTGEAQKPADLQALRDYYRKNGVGQVHVGIGRLPNTRALTQAIVLLLDTNQDGTLTQGELDDAETVLRKYDTNDDELLGANELLPNIMYPGCAASTFANEATLIRISDDEPEASYFLCSSQIGKARQEVIRSKLERFLAQARDATSRAVELQQLFWTIPLPREEMSSDANDKTSSNHLLVYWQVPGPLPAQFEELSHTLLQLGSVTSPIEPFGTAQRSDNEDSNDSDDFGWLLPLVDRNQDDIGSREEIQAWLAVQHRINRGQLLVRVFHGGGLFELLDRNHDGGLSIRELRSAWMTLESNACTSDSRLVLGRIPNVQLIIASDGYAKSLADRLPCDIEWFEKMDGNRDGDVSRREFLGSVDVFRRMDRNEDDLISIEEAAAFQEDPESTR